MAKDPRIWTDLGMLLDDYYQELKDEVADLEDRNMVQEAEAAEARLFRVEHIRERFFGEFA